MLKSKLYWKVFANFALLLVIMTAMTVLTMNILSRMKANYGFAEADMSVLDDISELGTLLEELPASVNTYALSGSPESRASVESGLQEFDRLTAQIESTVRDTSVLSSLKNVRDNFYRWKRESGDRKMALASLVGDRTELDARFRQLTEQELASQYMMVANIFRTDMRNTMTAEQLQSIALATELSSDVGFFITLVNLLLALFAIALGFVLTRSITTPVRLLKEGTQSIMAGRFETINLNRTDEFGLLASDFNKMSLMLGSNYTRLNAYSELVTALNTYVDIDDVQTESLKLLCQHAGASVGALYLMEDGSQRLELAAGYGLKRSGRADSYALGEGIPGECAQQRKTIELSGISQTAGFHVETGLVSIVPKYVLATPILFQDKVLGVMVLGSLKGMGEIEKEIIHNSVPQLGVAITNARNNAAAQQLSREIAKKNDELNAKNLELEKAYRVKSDFLASMSHELRTPLNSIIGFSSVLLSPSSDPLSEDQAMAMEKVLRNGKHLLQLINDILDFSKIESGRMAVNVEIDLVENVVSNSIMTVESLIKSKNLVLKQSIEEKLPDLKTDVLKIKQILVNLLSNAVKFTDKGEVSVAVKRVNGHIAFSVTDSGIGIEPKNLDVVFEEFQQIDSSHSRKYKGTGLGLPISRRLARMLGGDLVVESELGKGSTFTLTVPPVYVEPGQGEAVAQEPPAAPVRKPETAKPTPPPPEGGAKILCIDDDPDAIEILRQYLVPEGYSVAVAYSGDEGIRLARDLRPSLITLDIMMPQKDGWQVLRELKRDSRTKEIPVLIHSMIDNKPLALSLGAIDVMPKPVDSKALLSIVRRVCTDHDQFVLLVDNNKEYAQVLRTQLERQGFKARVANTGEQALKELQAAVPAMILLDVSMTAMDGFQVVRELNENAEWRKIPLVVLSNKELTENERKMIDSNIRQYMDKTKSSQDAISSTIRRILKPA